MSDVQGQSDEKPRSTRHASTQFTVTATGIAAMIASMPGVIATFKGEPVAEQVHKQTDAVVQKITQQQQKAYLALVERIIRLEAVAQAKSTGGDSALLKAISELPSKMIKALGKRKPRVKRGVGGGGMASSPSIAGRLPARAPKMLKKPQKSSEDAPKQLRLPRLAK